MAVESDAGIQLRFSGLGDTVNLDHGPAIVNEIPGKGDLFVLRGNGTVRFARVEKADDQETLGDTITLTPLNLEDLHGHLLRNKPAIVHYFLEGTDKTGRRTGLHEFTVTMDPGQVLEWASF